MNAFPEPPPVRTPSDRLDAFESYGINPFPHAFERSCALIDVHQDYSYVDGQGEDTTLRLMGRITGLRPVGRNLYARLEDRDASLQFFLSVNALADYEIGTFSELVRPGDWVGFHIDRVYRTTEDELTAMVKHWTMLAPAKEPPGVDARVSDWPSPRRGLGQRVMDDRRTRRLDMVRSKALRVLRRDLEDEYGFFEVNAPSPYRSARHDSSYGMQDGVVRRCPNGAVQAYLTDLLVGGFEAVYDVVRLSSSTSDAGSPSSAEQVLQCCLAPADMTDMVSLAERLVADIADEVRGLVFAADETSVQFTTLQLGLEWRRQSLIALVQVETGYDFLLLRSLPQAIEIAGSAGVDAQDCETVGAVAVRIAEQLVYPQLREPTFLVDYPHTEFPNAKQDRHSSSLAEMAHLFIDGICLGIAHTIQNDPRRLPELPGELSVASGLPPAGTLCLHIDQLLAVLMRMGGRPENES